MLPPFLVRVVKQLSISRASKKYLTYEDAASAAQSEDYENIDLVRVVVEKNIAYRDLLERAPIFDFSSLRTLIGLGLSNTSGRLNVIDFGGGGGYHYTLANVAFGANKQLRWNVVETPAMAKEAQRLSNHQLKFFDNISSARDDLCEIDLVFTSSALQYCPQPLHYLKALTELNAPFLFITRTPFIRGSNELITIQTSRLADNGPGPLPSGFSDKAVKYPITYASQQAVEDILSENYEIRFKIKEDSSVFKFNNEPIEVFGYFCARRS